MASPTARPTLPPAPLIWLFIAVLVLAWLARNILAPFVIAAVLAYAFTPVIEILTLRSRLPRVVVVVATYLAAVTILIGLLVFLGARVIEELQTLQRQGPNAIAFALRQLLGRDALQIGDNQIPVVNIARQLQDALAGVLAGPGDALHLAAQVADVALQAVLTLIVTFYFLLDGSRFWHFVLGFVPVARRSRVTAIGDRIHIVLGRWLRGQLTLIALVAVAVYVLLGPVLHVPYALAIAVLTGFLEVIPVVGPLIAGTIAGVVALSSGGTGLALAVIVMYVVLRQLEDQLVMPLLIGRAVHLHPVVTIFAVLVGLSTWGVLGGLLAVPLAAALNVALRELYPPEADPAIEANGPSVEPLAPKSIAPEVAGSSDAEAEP